MKTEYRGINFSKRGFFFPSINIIVMFKGSPTLITIKLFKFKGYKTGAFHGQGLNKRCGY